MCATNARFHFIFTKPSLFQSTGFIQLLEQNQPPTAEKLVIVELRLLLPS